MKPPKPAAHHPTYPTLPVDFLAGEHRLSILCVAVGRWTVSVDGLLVSGIFRTQVEAWEAGVRAAET